MQSNHFRSVVFAVVLAAAISAVGCNRNGDDGLSQAQHDQNQRITDIAKKAGGDWTRVSQADRDYILKNATGGDEGSAKMMVFMKAGKSPGGPGGGTPGAAPGGTTGRPPTPPANPPTGK
jgi:hypothetical protein